ncbi:lytic transglycosylase domain-containing protein [Deinococcus sp. HMF7604]|nr:MULTISPECIES: lytic transglycosylase domain-containing protein [Deinococcus]MBZ9752203.1 lytic transglycosylase domain-containing protein [Deinococcus betulae]
MTVFQARAFGLDPDLLVSLIWVESQYCARAVSEDGALGLGQLMPATAQEMGVQEPFDPNQNLYGAARYLRLQWDTFHDWNLALAAYNAGPGRVRQAGGVPPIPETQTYVAKVLGTYTALKRTPLRF